MQNEQSQKVAVRFWTVFDIIKSREPRGFEFSFIQANGTDIGRFRRLRKDIWRSFELSYLTYMVENYRVSAKWLLTGKGEMFDTKQVRVAEKKF